AWHELGRGRRHIYQGVADTMERKLDLEPGTLLDTPWEKLDPEHRKIWLYGTGKEHITFTWRAGSKPMMYGGRFEGIVPDLTTRYKATKSKTHLKQLEKYMRMVRCPACHGQRLLPQARAVRVTTASIQTRDQWSRSGHGSHRDSTPQNDKPRPLVAALGPSLTLPQVCGLAVSEAAAFFQELDLNPTQQTIAAEVLKEIRTRLG